MKDENVNESTSFAMPSDSDDLPALIAMTVYMVLLAVTGLVGNIFVIVSVAISPSLRTASYAFVVNLSVADLAVNVIVIPLIAVSLFNYGWPHDNFWCHFVAYLFSITLGCSLITLTMVAANRYSLASCSRKSHLKYCGWKGIAFILIFNWVSGVLLVVLTDLTGIATVNYNSNIGFCFLDSTDVQTYRYTTGVLIYFAVMCFLLIPTLYCKMFHVVHVSTKRTRTWAARRARRGNNNSANQRQTGLHPAEIKLTKMMAVIIILITICWTPAWVTNFFKLNFHVPKAVERIGIMLVLTNSSINPYLYAWVNKTFLRAYKRILRCGRHSRVRNLQVVI